MQIIKDSLNGFYLRIMLRKGSHFLQISFSPNESMLPHKPHRNLQENLILNGKLRLNQA